MSNRTGSYWLSGGAYFLGAAALAATLIASWRFNSALSADVVDSSIQGAMALIVDAAAVILVVACVTAVKSRSWPAALMTGSAVCLFLSLSFFNVLGYSASGTFAKVENAKLADKAAVEFAAQQNEVILERSSEHSNVLRDVLKTSDKRKDAAASERVLVQMGMAAANVPKLVAPPVPTLADPQATYVSHRTGLSEDAAREYRAGAMSLAVILAKLFGFGIGAWAWPTRRDEKQAALPIAAPAPVASQDDAVRPISDAPAKLRLVNDNDFVGDLLSPLDAAIAEAAENMDGPIREHLDHNERVTRFLDEATKPWAAGRIYSSQLYQAHTDWCELNNQPLMDRVRFGRILTQIGPARGITRCQDSNRDRNLYEGIGLVQEGMTVAAAA